MGGIITGGYGENSKIITSGYGAKWQPETEITKKEVWKLLLCPCCERVAKGNVYYTRDIWTGEKIFKCKNCSCIIEWNGQKWVKISQWWEDSW